MSDENVESPGWDAIDRVFDRIYPGQEPQHAAFLASGPLFGGRDPLQGISAYRSERGRPHWHLVTYGFSDLYEKTNESHESGYGFELTFRLSRGAEAEPPGWAFNFLQNLGRYVFSSGNTLDPGHYMDINGPISLGSKTAIVTVLLVEDDEAGRIETPNGSVTFVSVVGATRDEYEAARRWQTMGLVALLREQDPALVTDLDRQSVLVVPGNAARVEAGLAKDGSNCGLLYLDVVEVAPDRPHLTLGARGVTELRAILPYRLPFGRNFRMLGKENVAVFEPRETNGVKRNSYGLDIELNADGVRELLDVLQSKRGEYRLAACPDLTITVVPSETRDHDGKVIEVIG